MIQFKWLIFCCLLICCIGITSAVGPMIELKIVNGTLSLKGYFIYEGFGKYPAPIITEVNENLIATLSCFNTSYFNATTNITSNFSNCSYQTNYLREIPIVTNQNGSLILTDTETEARLTDCITRQKQFEAGLDACVKTQLAEGYYKNNYTTCSTDLKICASEKAMAIAQETEAKTDFDNTKNQRWIYALIALIFGYVARMYMKGDIGGPSHKKAEENYNMRQAA